MNRMMELARTSGADRGPRTARWLIATVFVAIWLASAAYPAGAQTGEPDPCSSGYDDVAGPCPDFRIDDAQPQLAGRVLTITAIVANGGDQDSPPTQVLAEGIGAVLVPVDTALPPEGSVPVPIRIDIPGGVAGLVDIVLTVDPDDTIDEYDDIENNRFVLPVDIPPEETTPTPTPTPSPTDTGSETFTTSEPSPTGGDEPTDGSAIPPWVWVAGGGLLVLIVGFAILRFTRPRPPAPPSPQPSPAPSPVDVGGTAPPPAAPAPVEAAATPPPPVAPPPSAPPASPPPPVHRPPRTVSTGIAPHQDPGRPIDPDTTLGTGSRQFFWLEVGPPVPGSIEAQPTVLPIEHLPATALLDVTLAALGGGPRIRIADGSAKLTLLRSGEVEVERQPDVGSGAVPPGPDLAGRRLFFDVGMPEAPGTYRMRCGIYHRQTLVQSRVVTLVVTEQPRTQPGALRSEVDYTLSASLDPGQLDELPANRLSLMLNRSDADTHDLLVLGEGGVRMDLPLDAGELENMIRIARGGLRLASWASEDEWDLSRAYRYVEPSRDLLRIDLATMAIRGAVLYAKILEVAASHAGPGVVDHFQELLRTTGPVQIALGRSARRVFPAALVYDLLGLDTTLQADAFSLCSTFVAAMDSGLPLETSDCFTTGCDTPGKRDVVCPSGFWGLRHELGLPVSELEGDTRATIDHGGAPAITVGVSTDTRLQIRP
ncbi:MAG TPA: hypothetical protein VFK59_09305, partial [Actinomycetota bacterium]|nr:hypothetical protein [Actinomycetota bacterium]